MSNYSKGVLYKVAVMACTATLLMSVQQSYAQEHEIINNNNKFERYVSGKLRALENDMNTLNRAIFKEGKIVDVNQASGASVAPSSIAAFDERINNIENDNREIINKLEKLSYDMRMLKEDVDKMRADYEQRFQDLSNAAPIVSENAPYQLKKKDAYKEAENVTKQEPEYADNEQPVVYSNGDAEKLYNKAFSEIKSSKYDEAEKSFEDFISKYSDHQLAPNSYYWLGETYYVRGDYKSAAKAFARCFQKFPDRSKALDSLIKLGLSLETLGKTQDACLSFAQLQKQSKNPSSPIHKRAVAEAEKLQCSN